MVFLGVVNRNTEEARMPQTSSHRVTTISFSNQKGGVGKTTDTRELGIYLASAGRRVLLIDADPQASLTKGLADDHAAAGSAGLYEALSGNGFELVEIAENLHLLAGSIKLAGLERSLIGELDAYTRIRDLLSHQSFSRFEYILIDTPPSLGVLTVNALTAANHIIIPMNPAIYSLQGTNDLMETVTRIRRNLNPGLNLLGVIINAFDAHPVITRQIREEIIQSFRDKVFSASISKSIKIEEAIAGRVGVISGRSKVSGEIKQIGDELMSRVEEI
jgi:chromosome partitioning protein